MKVEKINTKRKKLWQRFMADIYHKGFFTRFAIVFCLIVGWDISYKKLYVERVGDRTQSRHSRRKLTQILWIRFGYSINEFSFPKRSKALWKILKGSKKPKVKRTRRERKRVVTGGHQVLTNQEDNKINNTKEIKE